MRSSIKNKQFKNVFHVRSQKMYLNEDLSRISKRFKIEDLHEIF